MNNNTEAPNQILRLQAVCEKTGLSRSTIYLMVSELSFPMPIKLGSHSVGWIATEIDRWINDRIIASRGPQLKADTANEHFQ